MRRLTYSANLSGSTLIEVLTSRSLIAIVFSLGLMLVSSLTEMNSSPEQYLRPCLEPSSLIVKDFGFQPFAEPLPSFWKAAFL